MSSNKNTIIGFVLIALIFIGYVTYNNYEMSKQREAKALAAARANETVIGRDTLPAAPAEPVAAPKAEKVADKYVVEGADSLYTLKNGVMELTLASKGAQVQDVVMLDYTKYAKRNERNELVHLFDPSTARFNMDYKFEAGGEVFGISTIDHNFELVGVDTLDDAMRATLRLKVGEGHVDHIYKLYSTGAPERDYVVDFSVELHNLKAAAQQRIVGLQWGNTSYQNERSFKNENMYTTIAYHEAGEDDVEDLDESEGGEHKRISETLDWVSFKQQYFSAALIARGNNFDDTYVRYETCKPNSGNIKKFFLSTDLSYSEKTQGYDFSYYFGPNKYSILKKLTGSDGKSLEMERIIPLGWIFSTFVSKWIVIPIFEFLTRYIGSFGLIILLLTIIIKLIVFPLTYKSYLSTAKMRVIKPEVDAINAKYPRQEDAMKKQQATMELYRKAGINPMSGCFVMLIQMPILIAMFRFFPASIELRGKSFLWSDDLSSYDSILDLPFNIPFYGDHISLFCLLMTVVMFIYSYINYQQQGSAQPQMAGMKFMTVYMMPIMMLFWFNDYASGLCYYYLLSNLITIIQTTIIRFTLNDEKIREKMTVRAKNNKGKKSRFQQRYEELMKQAEAQQKR